MTSPMVWKVSEAGYSWAGRTTDKGKERILVVNRAWPSREYEPLALNTILFRTFLGLPGLPSDPGAILDFCVAYGHLGEFLWVADAAFQSDRANEADVLNAPLLARTKVDAAKLGWERAETLAFWVAQLEAMQTAYKTWESVQAEKCDPAQLQQVVAAIDHGCRDRVDHQFEYDAQTRTATWTRTPLNLLGAMWSQFAEVVAEGKQLRECSVCKQWFQIAPGAARSDKKTCSLACRQKAYRERKEVAVEMHARGISVQAIAKHLGSDVKAVQGWLKGTKNEGGEEDDGDNIPWGQRRGLDL